MIQHELELARLKAGKVPNVGQEGHSMNAYSSSTDVNKFSSRFVFFRYSCDKYLPFPSSCRSADWGIPEVSTL